MQKNKSIIVSRYIPSECIKSLNDMGYTVFQGSLLPNVDKPVAHHIDMQIVKCSDKAYLCAPCVYDHYLDAFENTTIELVKGHENPDDRYPHDVKYNIAITGKYAIHNTSHTDKAFFELSCYSDINVKQGYSKCNICVVSEDAIITSDKGIADTLSKYPIDVLLISEGHILLDGYNHGFIGGCSGLIENNLLAFAGDISIHPDYESIRDFCLNHGVDLVSLYDGDLVDIGTIVSVG